MLPSRETRASEHRRHLLSTSTLPSFLFHLKPPTLNPPLAANTSRSPALGPRLPSSVRGVTTRQRRRRHRHHQRHRQSARHVAIWIDCGCGNDRRSRTPQCIDSAEATSRGIMLVVSITSSSKTRSPLFRVTSISLHCPAHSFSSLHPPSIPPPPSDSPVQLTDRSLPPPTPRASIPAPRLLRHLRECAAPAAVRLHALRGFLGRGRRVRRQCRDRACREAVAVPQVQLW